MMGSSRQKASDCFDKHDPSGYGAAMFKIVLSLSALALVTACAAGPRQMPRSQIDRALANAPGEAQPSKVVARELEFARAARETGQWTAFRAFAASGAVIHGRNGPIAADPWLTLQKDPDEAVAWGPRDVWMSCDGALAVSQGRFRYPDGLVGTFVTVWKRQSDEQYLWVYDAGFVDDPQPPPRVELPPEEGNEIVVSAFDPIRGRVADCAKRGEVVAAPPAATLNGGTSLSRDGTLRWSWQHDTDGERSFMADYLHEGRWQTAFAISSSSDPTD